MLSSPSHIPYLFLTSCAIVISGLLAVKFWGLPPAVIFYVGYGFMFAYLITMMIIRRPKRGRRPERIAAHKRERSGPAA